MTGVLISIIEYIKVIIAKQKNIKTLYCNFKMKCLIWILFMYSSLCAQDLVEKRNSISLQIGELSSIRFQHSI